MLSTMEEIGRDFPEKLLRNRVIRSTQKECNPSLASSCLLNAELASLHAFIGFITRLDTCCNFKGAFRENNEQGKQYPPSLLAEYRSQEYLASQVYLKALPFFPCCFGKE